MGKGTLENLQVGIPSVVLFISSYLLQIISSFIFPCRIEANFTNAANLFIIVLPTYRGHETHDTLFFSSSYCNIRCFGTIS